MKPINFIVFALLLTIGCQTPQIIDENQLPEQIFVSELKSLLPPQLSNVGEKYSIYKDVNGKEYKVKILVENNFNQLGHDGKKYQAEEHVINFEFIEKAIRVRGQISSNVFGTENQLAQNMIIGIVDSKVSPLLGISIYYNYQTKSISLLSSPKYESMKILDKTFQNVFYTKDNGDSQYKNLKFNFEKGLVSFSDVNGNLYVFDRFE